jgi:selenocysteine lyase/cysteine desulfurase
MFQQLQTNPLRFFMYEQPKHINETIEKISKFVNADKEDVVLIENASAGFNAVLRSLKYSKGDKVLVTSVGYYSVYTTLKMLQDRYGIEIVVVSIPLPTTSNEVEERIKKAMRETQFKLVIIDHISSFPTFQFPVKNLIQFARSL